MLDNLYRFNVDDVFLDHNDRYVGLMVNTRLLRVPFYDVNHVSVFERRLSVQYKKSMNAIYRAEPEKIRAKQKEFERAGLGINNKG